jgi:hypothetical protein
MGLGPSHFRLSIFAFPISSHPYLLDMKVRAMMLLKTEDFNLFKINNLALDTRFI